MPGNKYENQSKPINENAPLTSQPVASERLLMRIRGVLPMASTSPLLGFFFFEEKGGLVLFEEDLDLKLQRKRESTATETEMAATTAPVLLTGAISDPMLSLVGKFVCAFKGLNLKWQTMTIK